jgi:hypothetical protein
MLERTLWHESITRERVAEMVERQATTLDNPGACLICGEEAMGVEPDAELSLRVVRRRASVRCRGAFHHANLKRHCVRPPPPRSAGRNRKQ